MGRIYKQAASDYYFADYVDENGKRVRKSTKFKTRRKAEEQLSAWQNAAREIRGGLVAKVVEHTIADALDEYEQASHKSEKYVAYNRLQVERVAESQGWTKLSEITAEGLERFVKGLDASARTRHSHITAMRIFCRWCVGRKKITADPTASVKKPPLNKSTRRMLERDEWQKLAAWLVANPASRRNKQNAQERLVMYWLAIESGLRSNELRSLTKADIVDGDEPHILCSGAYTKNSKDAKQFISDELAAKLQAFVADKHPIDAVFNAADKSMMATALRKDCVAAGVENTEVLDFHCLRHTTGSWLCAAGVPLQEVQKIMRHSSIVLTIDRYGHLAKGVEGRHRNILGITGT